MRIVIGIPTNREYKEFWDSMAKFLLELNKLHDIEVIEVRNKPIAEARNIIVDYFLETGKEYLLFLDDDHSGHTIEMLNALIKPNAMICAMKCYARHFPHLCTLMNYSGLTSEQGKYQTKQNQSGYDNCDLVGFGMTLIKRELFLMLEKPYFIGINNQKEDNYFCDNIIKIGIKPVGCFDYVCTHDGVNNSNIENLRSNGINAISIDLRKKMPDFGNNERLLVVA